MALRFQFEIDGIVQFDRAFSRMGDRLEDLRPIWDYAEDAFYAIEREQFAFQGSTGRSGKWKELTSPYKEIKAKAFPGKPILQRTGRMMASLTRETSDTVVRKEKQEFAIGSTLPYGKYHQRGTRKMAQREPISFSDAQRTKMQKAIQRGLVDILRKETKLDIEG